MARQNTWTNEDGLVVGFGTRDTVNADAGEVHTKGLIKQLKCDINFADLASPVSQKMMEIPSDAAILGAVLSVNETFDQAVEIGTFDAANTVIDADGLVATGAHAAGTVVDGSGALIGTTATVSNYVVATATATAPTTGRGQLVVEYIINNVTDV